MGGGAIRNLCLLFGIYIYIYMHIYKSIFLQMSASYSVEGLKWGNYLGSPDHPDPVLAWSEKHPVTIRSLYALPSKRVFGLKSNSCLLVMHKNAVKEIGKYN